MVRYHVSASLWVPFRLALVHTSNLREISAGVLSESLDSLRDGVLGKLSRQKRLGSSLDLQGGDGSLLDDMPTSGCTCVRLSPPSLPAVGTSNLPSLLVGSLLALLGHLERLFTSSDFLFNVCVSHDYSFN